MLSIKIRCDFQYDEEIEEKGGDVCVSNGKVYR